MCASEEPNKHDTGAPVKKIELTLMDASTGTEICKVKVNNWTTVLHLKEQVLKIRGYPIREQKLSYKHIWLSNNIELSQYGMFDDKNETCQVSVYLKQSYAKRQAQIEIIGESVKLTKEAKQLIDGIMQGFNAGIIPELTFEGTSGTYFLKNAKQVPLAVFKPIDEEANAPNNPRGFRGNFGMPSLKTGVVSGEASVREIAAYVIDKDGFSGVPETFLVAISHNNFHFVGEMANGLSKAGSAHVDEITTRIMVEPIEDQLADEKGSPDVKVKYGSLQRFVISHDVAENLCEDMFPDDEVHKIAILDLRILNKDRHSSNILVYKMKVPSEKTGEKKKKEDKIHYKLIPIDHGMSIPDSLDILEMEYCWLSWAHKDRPFSQKSLDYIKSINLIADIEMLNSQYKFRPICLRNMRLSGTILKNCAAAGLTLGEIGKIWCRTDDEGELPSAFEKIVAAARRQADLVHDMHDKRIEYCLAFGKKVNGTRSATKARAQFISADTEVYERLKERESAKAEETKAAVQERRERANTMLGEEFPGNLTTPKKLLEAKALADGLSVVHENPFEEDKVAVSNGNGKLPNMDSESAREEEKCSKVSEGEKISQEGAEFHMPLLSRTVSIPSKLCKRARSPVKKRHRPRKNCSSSKKGNGSLRDTAYDTEFFYYFEQFLSYEIQKQLKERENLSQ